jgi:hypothetical protein
MMRQPFHPKRAVPNFLQGLSIRIADNSQTFGIKTNTDGGLAILIDRQMVEEIQTDSYLRDSRSRFLVIKTPKGGMQGPADKKKIQFFIAA